MKGTGERSGEDRSGPIVALRFIETNMRVVPVPGLSGISLYAPHAGTGLSGIAAARRRRAAPYWAFPWAGGLALAHYLIERPETVAGRRVVDLGAGSGLVAIVAARLGAAHVLAVERDAYGRAAVGANARVNGVDIAVAGRFATTDVDLVCAGDVFYAAHVGRRVLARLERCRGRGIAVLVGDPYRVHLPRARLRLVAEYRVPDMGAGARVVPSGVFTLDP